MKIHRMRSDEIFGNKIEIRIVLLRWHADIHAIYSYSFNFLIINRNSWKTLLSTVQKLFQCLPLQREPCDTDTPLSVLDRKQWGISSRAASNIRLTITQRPQQRFEKVFVCSSLCDFIIFDDMEKNTFRHVLAQSSTTFIPDTER